MVGDAAAILLFDGPWPTPARDRLMASLLGEGAAVFEMDPDSARGLSPENASVAPSPTAATSAAASSGAACAR